MILFVFEGGKAEPMVFDSIGELFLSKEEQCVLKCEHDLTTLYSNLRANEYDLFRSLPFKENNIYLPEDKRLDTLFSQIFLFFDYDFQNRLGNRKSMVYWMKCWTFSVTKPKTESCISTIR